MALSDGAIIGLAVGGGIVGFFLLAFLIILCVRSYLKGPSKGSRNPKLLNGKVVVITGNHKKSYRFY